MTIAFSVLGTSGFLLLLFSLLMWTEDSRGERILLRRFRDWCDQKVTAIRIWLGYIAERYGRGTARIVFHFFAHVVLEFLLKILRWFERQVDRLQLHNKKAAKSVRTENGKNHLHLIAEHKVSTALTEAEKQDRKDKSIGV